MCGISTPGHSEAGKKERNSSAKERIQPAAAKFIGRLFTAWILTPIQSAFH